MRGGSSLLFPEFALAMFLVTLARNGSSIPTTLPVDVRNSVAMSIASIQQLANPMASATLAPAMHQSHQSSQNWVVSAAEKAQYDLTFRTWDSNTGFIAGEHARAIFSQSGLPGNILAHIWTLADIEGTGRLNQDEFAVAMHLIHRKLNGQDLPQVLPPDLVPPSYRHLNELAAIAKSDVLAQKAAPRKISPSVSLQSITADLGLGSISSRANQGGKGDIQDDPERRQTLLEAVQSKRKQLAVLKDRIDKKNHSCAEIDVKIADLKKQCLASQEQISQDTKAKRLLMPKSSNISDKLSDAEIAEFAQTERAALSLVDECKEKILRLTDAKIAAARARFASSSSAAAESVSNKAAALLAARMAALGVSSSIAPLGTASTAIQDTQKASLSDELSQIDREKFTRLRDVNDIHARITMTAERVKSAISFMKISSNLSSGKDSWDPSVADRVKFEEGVGITSREATALIADLRRLHQSILEMSTNVLSAAFPPTNTTSQHFVRPNSIFESTLEQAALSGNPMTYVPPSAPIESKISSDTLDALSKADAAIQDARRRAFERTAELNSSFAQPLRPAPPSVQPLNTSIQLNSAPAGYGIISPRVASPERPAKPVKPPSISANPVSPRITSPVVPPTHLPSPVVSNIVPPPQQPVRPELSIPAVPAPIIDPKSFSPTNPFAAFAQQLPEASISSNTHEIGSAGIDENLSGKSAMQKIREKEREALQKKSAEDASIDARRKGARSMSPNRFNSKPVTEPPQILNSISNNSPVEGKGDESTANPFFEQTKAALESKMSPASIGESKGTKINAANKPQGSSDVPKRTDADLSGVRNVTNPFLRGNVGDTSQKHETSSYNTNKIALSAALSNHRGRMGNMSDSEDDAQSTGWSPENVAPVVNVSAPVGGPPPPPPPPPPTNSNGVVVIKNAPSIQPTVSSLEAKKPLPSDIGAKGPNLFALAAAAGANKAKASLSTSQFDGKSSGGDSKMTDAPTKAPIQLQAPQETHVSSRLRSPIRTSPVRSILNDGVTARPSVGRNEAGSQQNIFSSTNGMCISIH